MFLEQRLSNPKWAHSYSGMFWQSMVFYGGSPPSPPPPPPPPDYAAANRAGVLADVQTLGARREIEQAAKLGGTALAFGITTKTDSKGNVTYYQTFNDNGGRYDKPVEVPKGEAVIDFRGKSDVDVAKAQADFQRAEQKANAQSALDLQKQYGTKFATEARNQLQAIDPTGYANRELLGKKVADTKFEGVPNGPTFTQSGYGPQYEMSSNSSSMNRLGSGPRLARMDSGSSLERAGNGPTFTQSGYGPKYEMSSNGPSMSRLGGGPKLARLDSGSSLERAGNGPSLSRQSGGPQFQGGDANAGGGAAALGRAEIERQLGENLFNNGKLTDEQARRLNNSVRGAQTARGNIYGNAPTAQEILTRSGAEQDMARQARSDVVGYLQSGQSSYDIANAIRQESNQLAQQGYINYSTANTVNNNLALQEYQNTQGALNQRNQASQTELSNRAQSAAFNNQAGQSEYQNYVNQVGANNAISQQEFQNQQASLEQRNQAQQSMYQNQLGANATNNQLAQQGYQNQQAGLAQRNQASQTELNNRAQSSAFNNQASQAEYQSYVNQVGVNNAMTQQEFQNQQVSIGQRNQAQQSMYANQIGANTANNQLAQQAYGNQLAAVQQRNAASQQGIANLQSYAGLQPIVTQGGQLGALGQGAAPTIQTAIPQGVSINPNAGKNSQDFALGVYGNQTSQYNAQLGYLSSTYGSSQQNSPLSWITGIGGVLF
jgi:hypothetical protein